ncbi:S41 family peptidase [Pedobacter psychrodurus]|uniref:S41 family peptidase n=1 Tax=Pedobacter psychrodurus TaxID=2530456 RepID=UPI0029314E9D|nr:S41 family peptidase [Pedobacter psychrodurus]
MKFINAFLVLLLSLSFSTVRAQQKFNGNFEILDKPGHPAGWDFTFGGQNPGEVKLDSLIKKEGKYSVSISADKKPPYGVVIDYPIKRKLTGKNLMLVGNIKTENISDGYAGLWMRVDGGDHQLEMELMEKQDLKGTNDWKEYRIDLPYDAANATEIHIGALITGTGKMWIDGMRLYLDEEPIDMVKTADYGAQKDTLYNTKSGVDTIKNTPENLKNLTLLGKIWGFLKYHHPAIANGDYNWDGELFKILPAVLKTASDQEFSALLEKWVDGLGNVPACKNCKFLTKTSKAFMEPGYGDLFNNPTFSVSLIEKLRYISKNNNIKKNYYISFEFARNPAFTNEKRYNENKYPDAGIRLLALYRYWNMIQYYSPNRNLVPENWNSILPKFIPQIILADNKYSYDQVLVKLVTTIHDSHGFIGSSTFQASLGKYRLPFDAKYIEDKIVVTGFFIDSLNVRQNVKIGDVIEGINGEGIDDMIKKYLPVTSSSNFDVAMRDMPGTYLLRAKERIFKLQVLRGGKKIGVLQTGVENNKIKADLFGTKPGEKSMRLINPQVGYVQGNAFKRKDLDSIDAIFANTRGLIVDMRGYPSDELVHTLGGYLGTNRQPFVQFSYGSIAEPGLFQLTPMVKSGKKMNKAYPGRVIVLVNAVTQSNAEFVTMAFQTAPNVKVIGSTTAGADGNISAILLPGGFKTWISGIGVFYPDGTNAQQTGVKINLVVKPTIEGIRNGKDEVLEKATAMIMAQ